MEEVNQAYVYRREKIANAGSDDEKKDLRLVGKEKKKHLKNICMSSWDR